MHAKNGPKPVTYNHYHYVTIYNANKKKIHIYQRVEKNNTKLNFFN